MGAPLDSQQVDAPICQSGRTVATAGGSYKRMMDDVLIGVPHEHFDSAAVLSALDSVLVCSGHLPTIGARTLLSIVNGRLAHAIISWADSAPPVSLDSIRASISALYGPAQRNQYGNDTWSAHSLVVRLLSNWPMAPGPHIAMTDGRGCEAFERMVHRLEPRRRRVPANCWVEPGRSSR